MAVQNVPSQPSRELDLRVQREVMGIVWDERRCRICGWTLQEKTEDGCVKDNCSMRPHPSPRADEPRPYSTSIEAAWEVVEKMRSDGHDFELFHGSGMGDCCASFFPHEARAKTAPEAICLAALATLPGGKE